MQQMIDDQVIYVVFVCKEGIWNPSKVHGAIPVEVEKKLELEKEDKDYDWSKLRLKNAKNEGKVNGQ